MMISTMVPMLVREQAVRRMGGVEGRENPVCLSVQCSLAFGCYTTRLVKGGYSGIREERVRGVENKGF